MHPNLLTNTFTLYGLDGKYMDGSYNVLISTFSFNMSMFSPLSGQ